jgi:hypothetical protein
LVGSVVINAGITSGQATAKLWDGSAAVSSGIIDYGVNGDITMGLSGIVTVTGTPTWKISVAEVAVSGSTIQATPRSNNTGLTNTASYLLATLIG